MNRSRMINCIKYHGIKDEAVLEKLVKFVYVPSAENLADLFTKNLGVATFERLRDMFMGSMSR